MNKGTYIILAIVIILIGTMVNYSMVGSSNTGTRSNTGTGTTGGFIGGGGYSGGHK